MNGSGTLYPVGFAIRCAIACLCLLLVGCGSGDPPPRPADVPIDYSALGPCVDQGQGIEHDVAGVVLPPRTLTFAVQETPPLVQLTGYVELTPIEFRDFYEGRSDVHVLHIEDEGFEAEVLIGDDDRRMYARAQVICEHGSNVTVTVGPAADAELLPGFRGPAAPARASPDR